MHFTKRKCHKILFSIILNCFQFLTASPCILRPNKILDRLLAVWSITQFSILIFGCHIIYAYRNLILPECNTFGRLNDGSKLWATLMGDLIIIPNGYFTRKKLKEFWQNLPKYQNNEDVEKFETKFVHKILICLWIFVCGEIVIGINVQNQPNWSKQWCCAVVLNTMPRLKQMQYILYVDVIGLHLRKLISMIEAGVALSEVRETLPERYLVKYLNQIRDYYFNIWRCVGILNYCFGLPVVFSVLHAFILLTCDMYWLIYASGETIIDFSPKFIMSKLCTQII